MSQTQWIIWGVVAGIGILAFALLVSAKARAYVRDFVQPSQTAGTAPPPPREASTAPSETRGEVFIGAGEVVENRSTDTIIDTSL